MSLTFARVFAAALAAGLLVLGVPQTQDAVLRLKAEYGVDLYTLKPADADEARSAVPKLEAIDARFDDPEARLHAALLRIELAGFGTDTSAREDLGAAAQDLDAALSRLPANDLGWYKLAEARFRLRDRDRALDALRTSILMGRYDPMLNLVRAEVAIRLGLDAREPRMLQDQVRFAWITAPERLAALARGDAWIAASVRAALDPDTLPAFEREFNRR